MDVVTAGTAAGVIVLALNPTQVSRAVAPISSLTQPDSINNEEAGL
jgi:hypothetical protein